MDYGRLLEQVAALPQSNAIVFDIHGEYAPLLGAGFRHFRVAGPSDIGTDDSLDKGVLYLPYWLLGYEALISMFVDRSDQNAPNQTMLISRCITDAKRASLSEPQCADILKNFTIDSPIPFSIESVLAELNLLNSEMVSGSSGREKQGPYYDKLSRLIARLEAKQQDRRLGFMFAPPAECMAMEWLDHLVRVLVDGSGSQDKKSGGVKVIDFSEVPSDVLPLMVSLVASLVFSVSQWTTKESRHPIALFCDEAHLYGKRCSAAT
jgi:hypothetical protein